MIQKGRSDVEMERATAAFGKSKAIGTPSVHQEKEGETKDREEGANH